LSTRRPARALAWLSAASVAAFVAVYAITVHTSWGQTVEDRALLGRTLQSPETLRFIRRELATISTVSLAAVALVLVVIALVRRRVALALGVAGLILGANLTTQVLKATLDRPDLIGAVGAKPSFPSGHATVAMSVVMAFMLVVPAWARPLTAVVGQLYATSIGVAVVGAGWHRPGDSIGAYLVCTAWAAGIAALLSGRGAERVHPPKRWPGIAAVWTGRVLLAAGLVVTAIALSTQVFDLTLDRGDILAHDESGYYLAAGNLITFSGLLVMVCLLLPLRGVDLGGRGAEQPRVAVPAPG
jgi:membrane-associated phospholipid phosphatase